MNTAIDISHIPFSRYGAYVSITAEQDSDFLTIHNVRKRFEDGPALKLSFWHEGKQIGFTQAAAPERLICTTPAGKVSIHIPDDETMVFVSDGVDLYFQTLVDYGYGTEKGEHQFTIMNAGQKSHTLFGVSAGKGTLSGPFVEDDIWKWNGRPVDKRQDLRVECDKGKALVAMRLSMEEVTHIETSEPDEDIKAIKSEWQAFLAKMPESRPDMAETEKEFGRVTWYNLWSSFARAWDVYHYDTMLMSKKFMSSVWSWDHCFNALAMAQVSRQTALEQFMAPFVLQAPNGVLPDMWNPNTEIVWAVTKPPIHGWCFGKLMDIFDFPPETLTAVYDHLEKWTNWWMVYRDEDGDGIPAYPQGCDSGWDNGSVFDNGYFVASPDLSAFLVLQMNTLARIADTLNESQKAVDWRRRSEELLGRMYETNWKNDRFVAVMSHSHEYQPEPGCLLVNMPVVLGELLDKDKMAKTAKRIEERFLTEYGLATEAPDSPRYEADGYWRGPIWAPSTYLIVDGLRRGGYTELAAKIAKRYLHMSCHVAKGNYENFDALTGRGLRAPGYTWSASVYMLLSWEFAGQRTAPRNDEKCAEECL